jgi:hypothetical protein
MNLIFGRKLFKLRWHSKATEAVLGKIVCMIAQKLVAPASVAGPKCPELAQFRPQIVPWSTLCRSNWVRNDPVLTTRGWLLRQRRWCNIAVLE